MFEIPMPFVWLILAVVLGVIEAVTVSLISVWFAIGALAAIIPAYFNVPLWGQILVFLAVSAIAFAFTKRFFKDIVKVKKQPTNSDSLIGTDGIVTSEIGASGLIKFREENFPFQERFEERFLERN